MLIYSHMKRSAIAAFASLLLAMPPAIAKITCADSIFTYGQVPSGSILNHTFTIKNDGQETVKINRVLSGCGCLSAKTDKESLKPTETAEIKATLSLRGRSGKQFKSIFVYTDSSETPIVRLETRGIALPSPTITERVAGEASSKKHRSLQEMIRPSGDSPTSQKIHAIPGLLRLPSKANQKGTFSFIAVRSTGGDEFKISNVTPPGGGTTDYAVDIFYKAVADGHYNCFVREDTVLPMMYMPDAIKATLDVMEAPFDSLKHWNDYNIAAMSFSAGELAESIRKEMPDFTCTFAPDRRQAIADSWPNSIDDSAAREEWGWKPAYDLDAMTADMLTELKKKHDKGLLVQA